MKVNPARRHKARRYAVQGLYHWQLTQADASDVIDYMLPEVNQNKTDMEYFEELITQIPTMVESIDEVIKPHLDRDINSVDPVERAILRMAVYELLKHPEIPYRVVINEAIEQAKTFGAEDGHKFVNGVLDKAAAIVREVEVSSNQNSKDA